MNLTQATDFRQLLGPDVADARYSFATIFSDEGYLARAHSKKKLKLLKQLDPLLTRMLYEDECVIGLTVGVQNAGAAEGLLVGVAILAYLNRTAVVLTTHRILMIRVTGKGKPRDLLRQLRYESIVVVKRSGLGNTTFKLRNGQRIGFGGIAKSDARMLVLRIADLSQAATAEMTEAGSVAGTYEELCPHCYEPMPTGQTQCAFCGGEFKSPRIAVLRSLIFPGLGDWYLGHRNFAIFEMLGASVVWLGALIPDPAAVDQPPVSLSMRVVMVLVLFVCMHGSDAWITGRIARSGLYPGKPPILLEPQIDAA